MSTAVDTAVEPLVARLYGVRRATTCYHEAGHALVATAVGIGVNKVTVVADGMFGGVTTPVADPPNLTGFARWEAIAVIAAAGIAAEVTARHEQWRYRPAWARRGPLPPKGEVVGWRRASAAAGGAQANERSSDLAQLQWAARTLWWAVKEGRATAADICPAFDPAWGARPTGVEKIAAHAWWHAVELVTTRWGQVTAVAELLDRHSDRDVTGAEVNEAVAGAPDVRFDTETVSTDFWPARYSRLKWRPVGMCREK